MFRRLFKSRTRLIMLGFAAIIVCGALLLMLPFATRDGEKTTVSGAFFSSVSASCVTGLVVYDTWTHWTVFGQIILLIQIQIGGLGFITIGVFAVVAMHRKIGLEGRELIKDSLSTLQIGGGVRLVRRIVQGTIMIEGIGAILLACRFVPEMGAKGIYYGIFHSISAFCNAGFDLMGFQGEYSSFVNYVSDPAVNIILMALIITGGIGFLVWDDVAINHLHWKKYRLQTKLVLTATAVLIVGGGLLFFIMERNGAFADMGTGSSILAALFSAVTPRTAGFNTVDTASLTGAGKMLTIFLMFIGGSPGSTAGGVKTTTLVVIILFIKSYLFRREDCEVFGRRLDRDAIRRASVVVFVNFILAFTGMLIILAIQDLPVTDTLFEVFSAIGTVGMSTGLTRDLCGISQVVIMLLMFCGRVGSLTFAMSFTERIQSGRIRLPEESIIVG